MLHQLKIRKEFADGLSSGRKTCEIRKNDRGYKAGDTIQFTVWDEEGNQTFYRDLEFIITQVLDFPEGLRKGWVALSIKQIVT